MEKFSALLALCAGNSPVPVNSPHKGQWRGALLFSLICAWINGWVNSRKAGDLRHHRAHYDVTVMGSFSSTKNDSTSCSISCREIIKIEIYLYVFWKEFSTTLLNRWNWFYINGRYESSNPLILSISWVGPKYITQTAIRDHIGVLYPYDNGVIIIIDNTIAVFIFGLIDLRSMGSLKRS